MNEIHDQPGKRQLVLCFHVHQPRRLNQGVVADNAPPESYLDPDRDREIMERISRQCYIPTNSLLLKLIEQYPQLKVSFAISGTALEQMEAYSPEALHSFQALAETGAVDFLSVPYYHSLAFLMEGEEFEIQILEHAEKILEHFGMRPEVFRNTHLIYNDEIGRRISMMGFRGVLTELKDSKNLSPHLVYEHRDRNGLKVLLRNHRLSEDIASYAPNLTPELFVSWLEGIPESEKVVTVAVDYEAFGEHHHPTSGIMGFLENTLLMLVMQGDYEFATAAETVQNIPAIRAITVPEYTMATGCELGNWFGDDRQREAFSALADLEPGIKRLNDPGMLKQWRVLQASDHFYYMSRDSGLSPYRSTQEAFHYFMRLIHSLEQAVKASDSTSEPEKPNEVIEAERRNVSAPVWALTIDPNNGHHG